MNAEIKKIVSMTFWCALLFLVDICVLGSGVVEYVEVVSFRDKVGNVSALERVDLGNERISCWRLCHRRSQCTSYFENRFTDECHIVDGQISEEELVEETGWNYYVKEIRQGQLHHCPINLGYTFDEGTQLCIKMLDYAVYRPEAIGNCSQDGGRILQIRNDDQQAFVRTYMQTFHPSTSPLIDGSYPTSLGYWRFDSEEPLTYFKWTANEPASNKFCIRVDNRYNFDWSTVYCSFKKYYLCEVPL